MVTSFENMMVNPLDDCSRCLGGVYPGRFKDIRWIDDVGRSLTLFSYPDAVLTRLEKLEREIESLRKQA